MSVFFLNKLGELSHFSLQIFFFTTILSPQKKLPLESLAPTTFYFSTVPSYLRCENDALHISVGNDVLLFLLFNPCTPAKTTIGRKHRKQKQCLMGLRQV